MKTSRSRGWLNLPAALAIAVITFAAKPTEVQAQEWTQSPGTALPTLVQYSGVLRDVVNPPISGTVGVTFLLYKDQQGGAPLWLETQNVQLDKAGRYSVMLGSTSSNGLPNDIFVAGEARWLAVQAQGQSEQPRVMLLSVPYALKAGDAETLGGLPVSAFALATSNSGGAISGPRNDNASSTSTPSAQSASSNVTTTGGVVNALPLWTTATNIQSSALTQTGTGSAAKIGINTNVPTATLDVGGAANVEGPLTLPATGAATATAGTNSQPQGFVASSFNSSTSKATPQTFQWQAEAATNATSHPSATLNLLFGSGTNQPAETGLQIASNGHITFALGQTFPGTGTGTITGVTAGTDLTGGGTGGNVTLNVDTTKVVTGIVAGTGITGGGTGGVQTLNIDTTKVPQLNTANIFTGNQTINGSLSAASFDIAGARVVSILPGLFNLYLGQSAGQGAGANNTGNQNTSAGYQTLFLNTTGYHNAAFGTSALYSNTTGDDNAGLGNFALNANTTGLSNTASGSFALLHNTTGSGNTAGGYTALKSNTTGGYNTAVGEAALLNTTTGSSNTAIGDIALSANTTGGNNVAVGTVAGGASPNNALTSGNGNTYVGAFTSSGTQTNLSNATAIGQWAEVTENNALVLGSINGVNNATASVNVGIGTTAPAYSLDVHGTANFTGLVTFAPNQKFPSIGTITGVTAGTGLIGGGTSGNVTLNVDTTKVVTGVVAGTGLTGGGTGGVQTLNLDTTRVPQLNTANAFTGNQTVNGNLSASGVVVAGSGFQIGGNLFAYGSLNTDNIFLGFSGNTATTGVNNTADGAYALAFNTSGAGNTAYGVVSLKNNTTGAYNTGTGQEALVINTTGTGNTAIGAGALGSNKTGNYLTCAGDLCNVGSDGLNNATALGAFAEVSASNALVLGGINGVNNATADTNVGIGTTAPQTLLHVDHNPPSGGMDVVEISSGGGADVASLLLQNTGSGGLRLRAGAGTGTTYLASSGSLELITNDTGSPSFPGFPAVNIDTAGDVHIKGTLSKGGGSFKIDHPLDPANKYLYHSFVESPDMMNVYNGNITTNKSGLATVVLPDYFEALNRDFRYQLTVIGQFAQAIIAEEITHSRFTIKTSKPGVKVSWQVTGIRHDAYADAHRIPTEEVKPPQEQGKYLHPELFGASRELAIGYVSSARSQVGADGTMPAVR